MSTGEVSGEGKQGVPSMYDLALGVLASITNSTRAPTRRDKAEVGHLAAMLALVDVVNGLRADLADRRDTSGGQEPEGGAQHPVQDPSGRSSLPIPPDRLSS